ncbi:MAG: hypothetical protein J7604_02720 [Sporocytophaga sp.]|uniref:hypothetical protein n=1 Tax=Sporocytophaga sp. TaxID=2231183 RepID=UPI001B1FD612|nr:hypothetical protein [Sporocytophaga sp.]MBO9699092.1 hypothetical protein [Sporocytophaga sp.]
MKKQITNLILILLTACTSSNDKLKDKILNADEVQIKENFHGGIAGGGTNNYTLKKAAIGDDLYEWILIKDKDTDFQTYITLDSSDLNSFDLFVSKAFESHDPGREYNNSCVFRDPSDYEFKVGFSKVQLNPSLNSDSIFKSLLRKFN